MYRLASLHLTERCAEILVSICHEIQEVGDVVGEEQQHRSPNWKSRLMNYRLVVTIANA